MYFNNILLLKLFIFFFFLINSLGFGQNIALLIISGFLYVNKLIKCIIKVNQIFLKFVSHFF